MVRIIPCAQALQWQLVEWVLLVGWKGSVGMMSLKEPHDHPADIFSVPAGASLRHWPDVANVSLLPAEARYWHCLGIADAHGSVLPLWLLLSARSSCLAATSTSPKVRLGNADAEWLGGMSRGWSRGLGG